MGDLPSIRVHDDGRMAVYVPDSDAFDDELPWMCVPPAGPAPSIPWVPDKYVAGPGWRDAVIVPLPSPVCDWALHWADGIVLLPARYAHDDAVLRVSSGKWLTATDARELAAALLAGAACLDRHQAEAVSTDG